MGRGEELWRQGEEQLQRPEAEASLAMKGNIRKVIAVRVQHGRCTEDVTCSQRNVMDVEVCISRVG